MIATSHTALAVLAPLTAVRFTIQGELSAQLAPRLLGIFAQRDLTPLSIWMVRNADGFEMRIEQDGLTAHAAEIILQRMTAAVEVAWASCEVLALGVRDKPAGHFAYTPIFAIG